MKQPARQPQRQANPYDLQLAKRIRAIRLEKKLSQQELGKALGVTCQQIQKYESGRNRVTAGRIYEICQVFDFPIAKMFEGLGRQKNKRTPGVGTNRPECT